MKKARPSKYMPSIFSAFFIAMGIASLIQTSAKAAISDYAPRPLADLTQPAKGQTFTDPNFGTKVLRLTDGSDAGAASVAYSYWPVFNSNSTKLMIALDWVPYLYDFDPTNLTFQKVGPMFTGGGLLFEGMTWSATDPNTIYGITGYNSNVKLCAYDVTTKQYTFVYDFTAAGELPVGVPSQMSKARSNDRYFSFHWRSGAGQAVKYAVVYDKQLNKTYLFNVQDPTYGFANFDECRLDRDGKYLTMVTGREMYIWQFADQTQSQRNVILYNGTERAGGHYELGSGLLIHSDLWGNNGNRVIQESLTTPKIWTQTFDSAVADWNTGQHLSMLGPDDSWLLISTESAVNYSVPFTNEIFLVKTNGSGIVQRIAHHRSSNKSYEVTPFANLSPDGRFVAYNSDWGGGHLDVYIAVLPTGLWNTTNTGSPIANITATPTTGAAPLAVSFSASGSSSPNGSITSYNWNFGDGTTGSGLTASHTYSKVGNYTAALTVFDSIGKTASISVAIAASVPIGKPTAKATATPTTGAAPLAVSFSASGSSSPNGSITSYNWNFGDGTTGSGLTASHTYSKVGNYTATVKITDNLGKTATASAAISVTAPIGKLTAKASATPASGAAPLAVSFSASGSSSPNGSIKSYNWSFGDGATSSGLTVSHTYSTVGNYIATVKITDFLRKNATASVSISVVSSAGDSAKTISFIPGDGNTASTAFDTSLMSAYPTYTIDTTFDGRVGGPNGAATLIALPNIFGADTGQIPAGAKITSATLKLSIYSSQATGLTASRILDPDGLGMWYTSQTISDYNVGVAFGYRDARVGVMKNWSNTAANLLQVLAAPDSTVMLNGSEASGTKVSFDVAASIAAWAAGAPNQGWAIIGSSAAPNSIFVYDSANSTSLRPVLTVTYSSR